MQETIIQTITQIVARNKQQRREPSHATIKEVKQHINDTVLSELSNMEQSGKIIFGDTLNDKYIILSE